MFYTEGYEATVEEVAAIEEKLHHRRLSVVHAADDCAKLVATVKTLRARLEKWKPLPSFQAGPEDIPDMPWTQPAEVPSIID